MNTYHLDIDLVARIEIYAETEDEAIAIAENMTTLPSSKLEFGSDIGSSAADGYFDCNIEVNYIEIIDQDYREALVP